MPDDFLDGLAETATGREAALRRRLSGPRGEQRTWVAELAGRVVGFAETGPAQEADLPPHTGELYTIYLMKDAAGKGIGRALMAHAVTELHAQGFRQAILWVLDSNARARRFYEAADWHPDGTTKTETRWNIELKEVRYARRLG
jgi:ribosomal protein S18 acetylase RimI-like enzyme